jgi:cellulose synthase (UDP-forming)
MENNKRKLLQKLMFLGSTLVSSVYIVWRIAFTLPLKLGFVPVFLGLLLIVAEGAAVLELALEFWHFMNRLDPELPDIPDDLYPHIDVLISTHNESPELLYKTVNACTYLKYPDRGKLHIFLCDDTNRPAAAALARDFGIGYFGLEKNDFAKAGNLNNALRNTSSPLILTLDADMIPRSNFLLRTVPYYFLPKMKRDESGAWVPRGDDETGREEKIGFVQTPQGFYNPDLFQYNLYSERYIPNEQDFFFREVNVGRNVTNSALYAGSNTLISREALESVGYIATNSITEDFETGIMIQAKGYRTYAVPETLAQGLAPTSVQSLINQRVRWARGCIQSLRNVKLLTNRDIPLSTKIGYTATFVYWWTFFRRFVYTLSPILFALFSLRVVDCSVLHMIVFWVPHYVLQTAAIGELSNGIRNQNWSNIIDTILFPYMSGPVITESLGIRQTKFVVTDKDGRTESELSLRIYALPHMLMLGLCLCAIATCLLRIIMDGALYDAVILYWLLISVKNLFFAICFMLGRPNFRAAERFNAEIAAEIGCGGDTARGMTCDVSETGLAVILDGELHVPPDGVLSLRLRDGPYVSRMRGRLVYAAERDEAGRRKYCVNITDMEEADRRVYMQLVFDREHSLPKTLKASASLYDGFVNNINVILDSLPGK